VAQVVQAAVAAEAEFLLLHLTEADITDLLELQIEDQVVVQVLEAMVLAVDLRGTLLVAVVAQE
jgi:hypothetical protein